MDHQKNNTNHFGVHRLEAFTDGVLAIVATLLILNIEVPENIPIDKLSGELFGMWPHYISYMLSFIIVGMYWYIHHVIMKFITRVDSVTLWLNLLFLMVIAYIPFPTELMSEYRHDLLSVQFFGISQVLTGFLIASLWIYTVVIKKNVIKEMTGSSINMITIAVVMPPIINLVALLAAFFNVFFSIVLFFIAPVLYIVFSRKSSFPEKLRFKF